MDTHEFLIGVHQFDSLVLSSINYLDALSDNTSHGTCLCAGPFHGKSEISPALVLVCCMFVHETFTALSFFN